MSRPAPPDWYDVVRRVAHAFKMSPAEVRRALTFPELAMGLDADTERRRPSRGNDSGPSDPRAGAKWWKGLSVRQRLNVLKYGNPDGE